MALDISGFVTPEQSFKGLTDLGEIAAKNRAAAAKAAEENAANQAVMNKMILEFSDPKDYLSGSPYDPKIVEGFSNIQQEAIDLLQKNKGINATMLYSYLAPKVAKIAKYATIAKVSKKALDEGITKYGENQGYDKSALYNQARNSVFFHDDGTQKDMDEVDLSINPFEYVIQNKPELVTTNKGIDEWLKGEPVNTQTVRAKTRDKSGVVRSTDVEITSPSWATLETDKEGVHNNKFIPQYELATESNQPIKHIWTDEKGQKHEDEVRILPYDTYKKIMSNSKATNDFVRGQVKLHLNEYETATGQKIDMNSPQAETLARAILYKELEGRSPGKARSGTVVMQPLPQRSNTYNFYGNGTGGGVATGIVFDEIGKVEPVKLKSGAIIDNGAVVDVNGQPYNGEIYLLSKELPTSIKSVMKAGGVPITEKAANFIVEDGQIVGMKTKKGVVDRALVQDYQDKWNTESGKSRQPVFGAAVEKVKQAYNKVKKAVGGVKGSDKPLF